MTNIIRLIAAAAAVAVLAFAPTKISARGCGDDKARTGCSSTAGAAAPTQLDQFMKTWTPATASQSGKRTRSVHRSHRNYSNSKVASEAKRANETKTVSETKTGAETENAAAETVTPQADAPALAATGSAQTTETDGVAVTSFSDVNEFTPTASRIQVVAFSDINEIDLAAPPPLPVAAETVSQAVSTSPEPRDNSWVGKLLLAAAATIALAGGVRLLVA